LAMIMGEQLMSGMPDELDAIQILANTLKDEREERALNIAHMTKHLRANKLMLHTLIAHSTPGSGLAQDLEAVFTHIDDIMLWSEQLLNNEVSRFDAPKPTENETIH